jgi:hypothetical protein
VERRGLGLGRNKSGTREGKKMAGFANTDQVQNGCEGGAEAVVAHESSAKKDARARVVDGGLDGLLSA